MRSILRLAPLLALLPLASTLSACLHPSTPSSIARTERPKLPTLNPELTQTEKLTPIGKPETGELVTVDKGWLAAVLDRLAEAIGAVTRGNERAGGVKLERQCTAAVLETGKAPASCPK